MLFLLQVLFKTLVLLGLISHSFACRRQTDCSNHGVCFFGSCFCHPGYKGETCAERFKPENPWYTEDCPNLNEEFTFKPNATTISTGRGCNPPGGQGSGVMYCAYLCYSHPDYGVGIIPKKIWEMAQKSEGDLWKNVGGGDSSNANDRAGEHIEGFKKYSGFPRDADLGDLIEVGSGPWTQGRTLLHERPDLKVKSYSILEPGAKFYVNEVASCTYKHGKLQKWQAPVGEYHSFPLHIISNMGEHLGSEKTFDTLVAMNVIEHVQSGFHYLKSLFKMLKPNGLIVFHERYYTDPIIGDKVLGRNFYHPIRLKKVVFDIFLSHFDIIFSNYEEISAYKGRNAEEHGFWIIGRKKHRN